MFRVWDFRASALLELRALECLRILLGVVEPLVLLEMLQIAGDTKLKQLATDADDARPAVR